MTTDTQPLSKDVLDTIRRAVKSEDEIANAGLIIGMLLRVEGRGPDVFYQAYRALWTEAMDCGFGQKGAVQATRGLIGGYAVADTGEVQLPPDQNRDGEGSKDPRMCITINSQLVRFECFFCRDELH